MKKLTKIEQLDQRFPGLADNVRKWFAQGVSAEKIAALLFERYQVSLSPTPISSFRSRRWVPEQDRVREEKIAAMVALEVASEQAIAASMASPLPGEVK